ncbi:homocysteine S-methyltransferase [Amycolatopsis pithecellobii]|uniref:Homocysteine S-methyltransferase n=1 Tax=Amycolatopsis pithecellobii TaxID=664692 RepID=A0A6N7Z7I9_9PSEU|nr:homocysteine S-methyltransferase [Amycolatopsis pithecellobii]MTD57080.1 homocysteine S-methyltransferase [Amycolatopsis pithecellobii]
MIVLDGGLATELEARGHDLSDALWSARLLADDPLAIVAAHEAFFRAGAKVATTASYQASFAGFAARGFTMREAGALLRRSVDLARKAASEAGGERWVAASVGPYGATLADGSEYRGRYGLSVAELTAFHRPRAEALAEAGPDVFALETVPDVDEAVALLAAVEGLGVPAWLSFTIDGEYTRAGQPLAEAFAVAAGRDDVLAVGVNCCEPDDAARAISLAREVSGKPVIAYPNSGETWDPVARRWAGRVTFTPGRVAGADLAGGCCRVGPAAITTLAALV